MMSLDRVIDAFARAAALSKDPAQKKGIMDQLTVFYKIRNNDSDAGLNDYVAKVLSRPLPLPGQPVTPATAASTSTTTSPAPTPTPPANTDGKPATSSTPPKP